MKDQKNNVWMYVSIAAIILLLIVGSLFIIKSVNANKTGEKKYTGAEMLTLWSDDSPAKKQLIEYVEAVTKEGGEDYIPQVKRIAVFDMDGTLCSETNPTYFDYSLYMHRILEDDTYKGKATDFEKDVARRIYEAVINGGPADGIPTDHGKCIASSFEGMSVDDFENYIVAFADTPAPGYTNLTRGESFYQPMIQVIDYLLENDFSVYIVSGSDRFLARALVADNGKLNLPPSHIIGSDQSVVATAENGEDGLDYQFTNTDKPVLGGEFLVKNLKMNKVSVINREIGAQPVLSFGNTTGDQSMAEYTISNNPYRSLAFMVCCDDLEREYGNLKQAQDMYDLCDQYGWTSISMKNDWKTIYGENVEKTSDTKPNPFPIEQLNDDEAESDDAA